MRMQQGKIATLLTVFISLSLCSAVSALEATPPPTDYYSPVFITAFQTSFTANGSLDVVELYNGTSEPIDMTNWSVVASDSLGKICTVQLSSWVTPDNYVVAANSAFAASDATGNVRSYGSCEQPARAITTLELYKGTDLQERIGQIPSAGFYNRKNTTKTYRSGTFSKDFELAGRGTVYAGQWYDPLPQAPMQIVEILAYARECSPLENAGDCGDYVKLYNPTTAPLSLSGLRLRMGYKGQSTTSNNALPLAGTVDPGGYVIITKKPDGSAISVTNDGGFVWLEDTYGITMYDSTVVKYPSASSATKTGWSWAYDETDGVWKWTSTPMPYNQANKITIPVEKTTTSTNVDLKTCAANQFRNPATNRCKLISSTISSVMACAANQYRNPATNRCKSLSSSTSSLTPCKSDQFRNPETNRCKSIASTASTLKPCTDNQERNAITNRCRNKTVTPKADYPVKTVASASQATLGWWAFGGAGVLAAGYAGWEWRREILSIIRKSASFFTFSK